MKNRKSEIIKCPTCGAEYLPGEIYIPNCFVGQPKFVEREHNTGKILETYGLPMDLSESYICDRCNTPFKVIAKIQFNTFVQNNIDFKENYKTKIKKESLFLAEN